MDQSDAIVLRTVEFSETSLVVTLLTRDFGKCGALAKGAKRPKSPFEGALDLLAVCRVVLIRKPSDTLDLLTEAKLQRRFRGAEQLRWDGAQRLERLYGGYYVAELIRLLTDEGEPQAELFDLTDLTLQRLEQDPSVAMTLLQFELQALRMLGHGPALDRCVSCGKPVPKLKEDSRFHFAVADGGLLCSLCKPLKRETTTVSGRALKCMQQLQGETAEDGKVAEPSGFFFTQATYDELRPLISRYLSTMLGIYPKTTHFLPSRFRS